MIGVGMELGSGSRSGIWRRVRGLGRCLLGVRGVVCGLGLGLGLRRGTRRGTRKRTSEGMVGEERVLRRMFLLRVLLRKAYYG